MRLATLAFLPCLALAAPAAAQDYVTFHSPSGNIHCAMHAGGYTAVRCDIMEGTLSFPQRPADCDLDWGRAFEVGAAGAGQPICHGDTVIHNGSPVLPYGQYVTFGPFTCTSETSGVTCTNQGGHGFTLRRAGQQVF